MIKINEVERIQSENVEIDLQKRTCCVYIKASSNSKLNNRFHLEIVLETFCKVYEYGLFNLHSTMYQKSNSFW